MAEFAESKNILGPEGISSTSSEVQPFAGGSLKATDALVICLLLVTIISGYSNVQAAQATKIYQVVHPPSGVAGGQTPIPVTATVYYNGTTPGYQLVVGILDAGSSPQNIVPGIVTTSTDPCLNQGEVGAVCFIKIPAASGVEHIEFQIGGIFGEKHGLGTWQLNLTSALLDGQGNLIPHSTSSTIFSIDLTGVTLSVVVPGPVVVSVDGIEQVPGPAAVGVALGPHNITVPALAQVDPTTRLRFDHWSDGTLGTVNTVTVTGNMSLEAIYVTQHSLTLVGAGENATGGGWYDNDSVAPFSTNQYQPITGPLGEMGAKSSFQGWYESSQLVTSSPNGTILMNKPHTLNAVWQIDYTVPGGIILVVVAAIVIVYLVVRQRKTKPSRRRRSQTRRRRRSSRRT